MQRLLNLDCPPFCDDTMTRRNRTRSGSAGSWFRATFCGSAPVPQIGESFSHDDTEAFVWEGSQHQGRKKSPDFLVVTVLTGTQSRLGRNLQFCIGSMFDWTVSLLLAVCWESCHSRSVCHRSGRVSALQAAGRPGCAQVSSALQKPVGFTVT